jgi:hypothetical protein
MYAKDVIFNKDFTTINTTRNKGEDNNMYDLGGGARSGLYTTTQIQLNEIDVKEPRTVGVVDLWKTKKEDGIILKYRKKIEKLKSEDKLTLLKREYMDKAIPLLSDGTPCCEEHFGLSLLTKETKKQISLLKNEESAEDTKLLLLYKEIMSQLVACETYEQEINILNIYGVLKDGKVNA